MIWVLGGFAYVVAVASIVRFFKFVAETDQSIDDFWDSKDAMARTRPKIRATRLASGKMSKRIAYKTTS
jgi:hypothetical protein